VNVNLYRPAFECLMQSLNVHFRVGADGVLRLMLEVELAGTNLKNVFPIFPK